MSGVDLLSKQTPRGSEFIWQRLKEIVLRPTSLVLLVMVVFLIVMGISLPSGIRSLLMEIMIFSIYGMAYDILFGFSNQFSYGQALFFGVGAYGVLLLALHLKADLWTAMLVAVMLSLVFAFVLGILAVRLSEAYFVVISVIFNMVFYLLALDWTWLTGGDDGLTFTVPPIPLGFASYSVYDPIVNYYFILFFVIATYLILKRIIDSPFGKILISIRENEERAEFLGYNVIRYKLIAYIISAMFTGLSGTLYAIRTRYASADYFSLIMSADPIIWTLIGGAGTLIGPIVGVVILRFLTYYISVWWRNYFILIGGLMILVLRVSPKGIVGYIASKIGVKF